MKYYFILLIFVFNFISCQKEKDTPTETEEDPKEKIVEAFGFILNDFEVVHDTIKSGDTFGKILENFSLGELKSHQITEGIKDSINLRNIRAA
ncbi:MAG: M23 family peptidase, partial [Flavobacterium sp.]